MHEIRIPKYGMSTVEVDVTEMHVKIGQQVAVGDPIVDVDTEKVSQTLESDGAGTVTEILMEAGKTYEVGDVVCRLSD